MAQATTFHGVVQGGKLALDSRDAFARFVARLDGKRVTVSVQKFRKQRSLAQQSWYWGVLIPILAEHLGYDKDDLHEALKMKFLRVKLDDDLETVKSSAKLTTEEYSRWMEDCQRLAAEYGVDVPMPNEAVDLGGSWERHG